MHVREHAQKNIGVEPFSEPAEIMKEAAAAYLASLTEDQRRRGLYPVESKERFNWDYRPRRRAGLAFKEMEPDQQKLAYVLLASGLSRTGLGKALAIMSLEKLLAEKEGNFETYHPDFYSVTLFGIPSSSEPWGWRIEGHHLSVNFLIAHGSEIAFTPNFFGANPAEVLKGPRRGFRVLAAEEDAARQLLLSLDPLRRSLATIDAEAPADIVTRWEPRVTLDSPVGLAFSRMAEHQKPLALQLLFVYTGRMPDRVADEMMNRIEKEGVGNIHFAWAGSAAVGEPHYYRLHGPSLLVEYDNTQNHANHIHTVWRDLKNDWGDDLLRAHVAGFHRKH